MSENDVHHWWTLAMFWCRSIDLSWVFLAFDDAFGWNEGFSSVPCSSFERKQIRRCRCHGPLADCRRLPLLMWLVDPTMLCSFSFYINSVLKFFSFCCHFFFIIISTIDTHGRAIAQEKRRTLHMLCVSFTIDKSGMDDWFHNCYTSNVSFGVHISFCGSSSTVLPEI